MKNILVVEDDMHISNLLRELLTKNGHHVTTAFSGSEALMCFERKTFDLVLLDLMIPGKSGAEVIEALRVKSDVSVLILTAVTDKESIVHLLRLGADDYLTKPFDNDELLARVDARLRRDINRSAVEILQHKNITLDLNRFDAICEGNLAQLSKREFEILRLLMSHPQKVFTKDNLYESVWGGAFMGDDNTINVHMSKLRAKLHAIDPFDEHIQTIRGIGYRMA